MEFREWGKSQESLRLLQLNRKEFLCILLGIWRYKIGVSQGYPLRICVVELVFCLYFWLPTLFGNFVSTFFYPLKFSITTNIHTHVIRYNYAAQALAGVSRKISEKF